MFSLYVKRPPLHCTNVNLLFIYPSSLLCLGSRTFDFMLLDNYVLLGFRTIYSLNALNSSKQLIFITKGHLLIIMVIILQFCFRKETIFTSNLNWTYLTFQMEAVQFPDYDLAISNSKLRKLCTF